MQSIGDLNVFVFARGVIGQAPEKLIAENR